MYTCDQKVNAVSIHRYRVASGPLFAVTPAERMIVSLDQAQFNTIRILANKLTFGFHNMIAHIPRSTKTRACFRELSTTYQRIAPVQEISSDAAP